MIKDFLGSIFKKRFYNPRKGTIGIQDFFEWLDIVEAEKKVTFPTDLRLHLLELHQQYKDDDIDRIINNFVHINSMDYDSFLNKISHTITREWAFFFTDDPQKKTHTMHWHQMAITPYHLDNKYDFSNAKDMLEAKVFDGKSIKDRWNEIVSISIGGINFDEWKIDYCL